MFIGDMRNNIKDYKEILTIIQSSIIIFTFKFIRIVLYFYSVSHHSTTIMMIFITY